MPWIRAHITALLATLLAATYAAATEPPLSLRAVTAENNEPFNIVFNGKLQGLGVDVANEAARRSGFSLQTEALPWARALETARQKPDVLLFTVARTPEREDWFHWIGPIAKREVWLWRLRTRKDVVATSLDQAKQYRVGASHNDAATEYLLAQGFEQGLNLDITMHDRAIGYKLLASRVDLVPMNPLSIGAFARESGIPLEDLEPQMLLISSGGYYLALNRLSKAETVAKLNAALVEMKADGSLQRLLEKWQPKGSKARSPSSPP
ncbi:transporter substrate-binding domain-containing protein [Chitinimonas viridis]|uniref:Transporter substrate-binding domain-containing protein n=1 Tax=Chitinimonas viridis TaxID=664880 RepID=A0ABT8BA01_9NEIS|nr:transporter substrate-binding domain-containing protein [Chitinimonas viridis]MDN3579083.1 transporter substrate-binding domain-containing protein [Chitinimonas viridis]